jgi:hypothetical protein
MLVRLRPFFIVSARTTCTASGNLSVSSFFKSLYSGAAFFRPCKISTIACTCGLRFASMQSVHDWRLDLTEVHGATGLLKASQKSIFLAFIMFSVQDAPRFQGLRLEHLSLYLSIKLATIALKGSFLSAHDNPARRHHRPLNFIRLSC